LKEYIDELTREIIPSEKNDKMDFSRYPFTKKDGNHFYVDTLSNVEVDIENLRERILAIFRKLEQYADFFYYERLNQDKC
jgi:hypothetical protein